MNSMLLAVTARVCGWGVFAFCLLGMVGCESARAPVSDIESGRQLLVSSLSDWKQGVSVAAMKQKSQAVYVSEELWEQGYVLNDFKLDSEGELYGTNVRIQVTLQLTDKANQKSNLAVTYLVTTTPALTIARGDRPL